MINEPGPTAWLWVPRGLATKGQQLAAKPGPTGPNSPPSPLFCHRLSFCTQAGGRLQDLAEAVLSYLEVSLRPYRPSQDSSPRKSSHSEAPGTHCSPHLAKGHLCRFEIIVLLEHER